MFCPSNVYKSRSQTNPQTLQRRNTTAFACARARAGQACPLHRLSGSKMLDSSSSGYTRARGTRSRLSRNGSSKYMDRWRCSQNRCVRTIVQPWCLTSHMVTERLVRSWVTYHSSKSWYCSMSSPELTPRIPVESGFLPRPRMACQSCPDRRRMRCQSREKLPTLRTVWRSRDMWRLT